jgi:phosphomannomutase
VGGGHYSARHMAALDAVFKAYDIRGTVPDQLDAELAGRIGAAFAVFADAPRIVVARDMRPSGVDLSAAFARGVVSVGVDVVDVGLTSTDELYFASGALDAPGAMFTASHNPARYNGIKLCLSGARPVGAESGLVEIRAAVESGTPPVPVGGGAPRTGTGRITTTDVLGDYVTKVRSFVDRSALRPLKVVADTANGMGGLVVPAVFADLPFDLEILFGELDGTFPNHPADPIQPANLVSLQERVLATGADVGLAFDGDADRCFLVDDQGSPVSGSTTTAMVAASMLEKNPGSTILYNLICSKAVPEIVTERGGTPIRTRVGHSYIKGLMAETDAVFGGEHSGHYYFRDNFRADSGSIAALVVLELLSAANRPLSAVRTDFERYADSGEINTEVSDPHRVIEAVAGRYPDAPTDRLDGLTVDLGEWWFNLRPSNTEPLLRLNLEAADAASCSAHTETMVSLIKELS